MSNLRFSVNANGVGATVHHAMLAVGQSAHHILQIRDLLNRHRVVVFPGQKLTDEELLNFAFRFGPPFIPSQASPVLGGADDNNHIVVIGNQAHEYPSSYLGHQEVLPHSDHQWLRCPSSISMLYAIDIHEDAAPTVWTDMARGFSLLDPGTREMIQDLRLITYNPFYRPFGTVSAKYVDRSVDLPPGATYPHPLVRTHPETHEKVLYLNAAYEVELVGIPFDIGSPLISELHTHIHALECRCEHFWSTGDLVIWDNQATLHYRPEFARTVRRVLKRVTLAGGVPY